MSSIASAFSNFADMPAQQTETLNVPKIVKLSLDIFNERYIDFISEKEEILADFDRTQLIRVVTFTTKTSGMGLGLAMVKNIIETYKGNITFTSEEGEGTIFKVTFPKKAQG